MKRVFGKAVLTIGLLASSESLWAKPQFDLYLCNAGIGSRLSSGVVCLNALKKTCSPGTDGCVCSGGADFETNRAQLNNGAKLLGVVTPGSGGVFRQVATDDLAWSVTATDFSINLGSEIYGAAYFVDYCLSAKATGKAETLELTASINLSAGYQLLGQARADVILACEAKKSNADQLLTNLTAAAMTTPGSFGSSIEAPISVKSKNDAECKIRFLVQELATDSFRAWKQESVDLSLTVE